MTLAGTTPTSTRKLRTALGIGGALVLISATGWANGRFPRAFNLAENPENADQVALAATYGLLLSNDSGDSFHYVCETAFARNEVYLGDPLIELLANGDLVVGIQTGVSVSRDDGCTWQATLGTMSDDPTAQTGLVPDFTLADGTLVALVVNRQEEQTTIRLEESLDGAESWTPLGANVPLLHALTLEVAPSDPERIYVSGFDPEGAGALAVSSDRGQSWELRPIPGTNLRDAPYVGAVHPTDPERVFVRTDGKLAMGALDAANDALFYTRDAGQSFVEVVRRPAKLLGLAIDPAGSTLLLGYGDPVGVTEYVDPSATGGLMLSVDALDGEEPNPSPWLDGSVTCLSWTDRGIYVCRSPAENGAHVALLPEPDAAAELAPIIRLEDVEGPLSCAARECASSWEDNCTIFKSCPGVGGRAGQGGGAGSEGAAGSDGDGGEGGARVERRREQSSGCGLAKSDATRAELWLMLMFLSPLRKIARWRCFRRCSS